MILIGGTYLKQSNSLIGPLATQCMQQVYASKCFVGVDGVSQKYGLTNPLLQGAEISRTMIERTRGQVIVVADHSKLGVVADFMIAPLDKVDCIVTDASFDEDYRSDLEAMGIEIIIAPEQSFSS